MRKKMAGLASLVLAVSLMACGFFNRLLPASGPEALPTAAQAQSLPALEGDWRMSLIQTGGIAGISRSLELKSSGEYTIIDQRSGQQRTGKLPPADLEAIKHLVATSGYREVKTPRGCADCFLFDLQISAAGGDFQMEADQVNLPDTGLEPLVNRLAGILNAPQP